MVRVLVCLYDGAEWGFDERGRICTSRVRE